MEKEKGIRGLAIVALLVALITLTIAFAAMSRTLNITNTTVKVGKFNVGFKKDNSFSGNNKVYEFVEDYGVSDETTNAQIGRSYDTDYDDTVSNLHPVFNMTGITARYILKIYNNSSTKVGVDTIILPEECNNVQNDLLVCSLKNLGTDYNKTKEEIDNSPDLKKGDTIDAESSIYVSFNIYAKNYEGEDFDKLFNDQIYNLELKVTYKQFSTSHDDSISDTYYDVGFYDLSNFDFNKISSYIGYNTAQALLFENEQGQLLLIGLQNAIDAAGIEVFVISNFGQSDSVTYNWRPIKKWWDYTDSSTTQQDVSVPTFYRYKMLSEDEMVLAYNKMGISSENTPLYMNDNIKTSLLKIELAD